jgi:hypothetical protein
MTASCSAALTIGTFYGQRPDPALCPEPLLGCAEMDGLVRSCKALGVKNLNLSTTLATVKELLPYAEKYEVMPCPHGHSITWDKEEFSTTETFETAFKLSKWLGANIDIGHFSAIGKIRSSSSRSITMASRTCT